MCVAFDVGEPPLMVEPMGLITGVREAHLRNWVGLEVREDRPIGRPLRVDRRGSVKALRLDGSLTLEEIPHGLGRELGKVSAVTGGWGGVEGALVHQRFLVLVFFLLSQSATPRC